MMKLTTSFRQLEPGETLLKAKRLAKEAGITRVSEITYLDQLNIPVHASIRPRGKALSVHAGKGLNALESEVGAYMEAIEFHFAERPLPTNKLQLLTPYQLAKRNKHSISIEHFCPNFNVQIDPEVRIPCIALQCLGGEQDYWVPVSLVSNPAQPGAGSSIFASNSNGLASGNTVEEALAHALFELIERDIESFERIKSSSVLVNPSTLPLDIQRKIEDWEMIGISTAVHARRNSFGLPFFKTYLVDKRSESYRFFNVGYGCHVSRTTALYRSLTEAAQSRLAFIHGAREDLSDYIEAFQGRNGEIHRLVNKLFAKDRVDSFSNSPDPGELLGNIREVLACIAQSLSRNGMQFILHHRFTTDETGIEVVRAVVPGLENFSFRVARVGPRLWSFFEESQWREPR